MSQLSTKLSSEEVAVLKQHEIVFIPGFLNSLSEKSKHFEKQVEWLRQQGLESTVATYSLDYPKKNLQELLAQIKFQKPVLIMSHSMGSILTMRLLLAHPELQSKLGGWISVNGTLKGSPIADLAYQGIRYALPPPMRAALEVQTQSFMSQYIEQNRENIEALSQKIPSLFVASWSHPKKPEFSGSQLVSTSSRLVQRLGHPWNDGLVPTGNSVIGCFGECLIMPQTDHFSTLQDTQVLRALLQEILERSH